MDTKKILQRDEYNFLREDERLGKNIAYLTIAGSIAYGTDNANSDVDIRGFAVENFDSILTGKAFEQIDDDKTDTVIYGLRKFFKLCAEIRTRPLHDRRGQKSSRPRRNFFVETCV